MDAREYAGEQITADSHLGQLERYGTGMADNPRTNLEIVTYICSRLDQRYPDAAPHERLIAHVADRPGHDRRYVSDPARIEGEVGWRAGESFEDGITATVDWYLDNEGWCEAVSARYGRQRLGLGANSE